MAPLSRRLTLVLAPAIALAVALAATAAARVIVIVGPNTPRAHSSPGMVFHFKPRKGPAGTQFKGTARGFARGEYVTAWEFSKGGHSSQLLGDTASARGRITVYRQTAAGISSGKRKVCLQGERTRRVACANYRVKGGGRIPTDPYTPPTTGPGYTPPQTGPGYVPPGSG